MRVIKSISVFFAATYIIVVNLSRMDLYQARYWYSTVFTLMISNLSCCHIAMNSGDKVSFNMVQQSLVSRRSVCDLERWPCSPSTVCLTSSFGWWLIRSEWRIIACKPRTCWTPPLETSAESSVDRCRPSSSGCVFTHRHMHTYIYTHTDTCIHT